MRRTLVLVAALAVALAAPMAVEGKKKKPPIKITLKSWQGIVNQNDSKRIAAGKNSPLTYCADDSVTAIVALGQASPATKGRSFSIRWRVPDLTKPFTLPDTTGKKGKVEAGLHHGDDSPLPNGTYVAKRYNPNKKTSRITITLKADPAACPA